MSQFLLVVAVALTAGVIVFGITVLVTGVDALRPAEPDGRAVPLPADRPLVEPDVGRTRFDTALRGYRMDQVDEAMRRAAYDIGYKDELIKVLLGEVDALREGKLPEAEALRRAREAALAPVRAAPDASGAASDTAVPEDAVPEDAVPEDAVPEDAVPEDAATTSALPAEAPTDGPIAEEAGEPADDTSAGAETVPSSGGTGRR